MSSVQAVIVEKNHSSKQEESTVVRGRRPKKPKAPTRFERLDILRNRILQLKYELEQEGFGSFLKPPGPIKPAGEPIRDPKTEGMIVHASEPLGTYIQRVSVVENFSQRPPFDHVLDPIYKKLIRDFIKGAVVPESKLAALRRAGKDRKAPSLHESGIEYSIIDGLQRLYCFCIAILLVLRREKLVEDNCIPLEAWSYFENSVGGDETRDQTVQELLNRTIRYETFYNIDLEGLLHYMVTFNTGQRRMSLPIQLEIMRRPLIRELEDLAKIPIYHEIESTPGAQRPKDKFKASDLILATEAFITSNAQVTPDKEAVRFLIDQDRPFIDDVGDVGDVIDCLKRIATEIHPKIVQVYDEDIPKKFILSGGGVFLISLAAACGYIRNHGNMTMVKGALEKIEAELSKPVEDPLRLTEYFDALGTITASRGKATRRLVYDTFLRFFLGATKQLEWMNTAASITG